MSILTEELHGMTRYVISDERRCFSGEIGFDACDFMVRQQKPGATTSNCSPPMRTRHALNLPDIKHGLPIFPSSIHVTMSIVMGWGD
jgi:hypothetical protein